MNYYDEIIDYINNQLFEKLFVFHPKCSIKGNPEKEGLRELKGKETKVIISVDRNVLSDILMAAKNGCFDACKNKKETTAFLIWVMINNFGISPYDALKEQAFIQKDNISGNKENDIFNYFFDTVKPEVICKAFYEENVKFTSRSFQEASETEILDFLPDNADFLFLYATILHLVYELRSGKDRDKQFKDMIKWYWSKCLISQIALSYLILLFTKDGITPPHNYMNNEKVIHGCMNEAMDLYYFQEIDPRRYPSDQYTLMIATQDIVMKDVFSSAFDFEGLSSMDEYITRLCCNAPKVKKEAYTKYVLNEYHNHKMINVDRSNAYEVAQNLCEQEKKQLEDLLGI